jgi:gas vesicle protein
MRKFGILLFGTVLGGLIGSSLALLLTPVAGIEIRKKISSMIGNVRTEIINASKEKRLELETQLEQLRSEQ